LRGASKEAPEVDVVLGRKDLYAALQVHQQAHPLVIKAAYRTLMGPLKNHPDLGGDASQAQMLNEAYEVLSDPASREVYDGLRRAVQSPRARPSDADPYARLKEIEAALAAEYRAVRDTPLAALGDLVLEGAPPFRNRLIFRVVDPFVPSAWKEVFALSRLAGLRRPAFLPASDAVVVVTDRVKDRESFLRQAAHYSDSSPWRWKARSVTLLEGDHLHVNHLLFVPHQLRALRRLIPR
jgi:curved DNA-binding protein CbpA